MSREVYIPEFVDLDSLEFNGKKLSQKEKDKAAFLLSLITINTLHLQKKEKMTFFFGPYADSRTYQGMVHEYKSYLELLEKENIIIVGKSYLEGEFAKSVLITDKPEYRPLLIKPYILSDIPIIKKLYKRKKDVNTPVIEKYPFLARCFNNNFDINLNGANKWLEKNKKTDEQYNVHLRAVRQIHNRDYYFKTDRYGRLYTPVCNLKRELRRFLSYNGLGLVSIDISNSQPFLLGLLMNPEYYKKENADKSFFNYWNLDPEIIKPLEPIRIEEKSSTLGTIEQSNLIRVETNDEYGIEEYMERRNKRKNRERLRPRGRERDRLSIYMLEEYPHLKDNEDVNLFKKLTQLGNLYEYLIEQFNAIEPKKLYSRDEMKKKMLLILFSKDGDEWYDKIIKPKFKKIFPTVYKVIKQLKRTDYKNISHLLTNVESKLIIDTICKEFAKKHYRTPIFTIHDSIATTEPNIDMLKEFFTSKCKEILGVVPQIKIEKWQDITD
ncbi:hypothetical protein ACFLTI_05900 [Bacteroidota bacterium]